MACKLFLSFQNGGQKSSMQEDVSGSLKQCCESLASGTEGLQKYASTSLPRVTTETTGNNQLKSLEEHRKLLGFKPSTTTTTRSSATTHGHRAPFYSRPSAERQRTSSEKLFIPVQNTWTHKFFSLQAVLLMKSSFRAKKASMNWQDLVKKTLYLIEMEMPNMSQKNVWNRFQTSRIVVLLKS